MMKFLIDHWVMSTLVLLEVWGWRNGHLLGVNGALLGLVLGYTIGWVIWQVISYRRQGLPVPRFPDLVKQLWQTVSRRAAARRRWDRFCRDNQWGRTFMTKQGQQFRGMGLNRLVPAQNGDLIASINPASAGVNPEKVWSSTDYLASAIGCREVTLKQQGPSTLKIKFTYSEPLSKVLPIAELPLASKGHLAYGTREDGTAAEIPLDLHTLIGGMTRQGKSSMVWALIADAIRQQIPLNLWISDPKGGSEFHAFQKLKIGQKVGGITLKGYATDDKSTQEMLEKGAEALRCRQRDLGRRNRRKVGKFSDRDPLNVFILDEFLALPGVIKQANSGGPLRILMSQGGAAGYIVWGLAQIGHAEVLKTVRNLFNVFVCFKVPNSFTQDTFLGPQSASRGAKSYRLSSTNHRGVGYSGSETEAEFTIYRAGFVSDRPRQGKAELSDIARITAGVMPLGMEKTLEQHESRSATYIAWSYPDDHGARTLLYWGKSNEPGLRIEQHIADPSEPWWSTEDDPANEVDPVATYESIRWHDSEKAALAYEKKMTKGQAPQYNSVNNTANPARRGKDQRRKKVQLRIVKDEPETVEVAVDQVLDAPPAIDATRSRKRKPAPARSGPVDYEGEREPALWGE